MQHQQRLARAAVAALLALAAGCGSGHGSTAAVSGGTSGGSSPAAAGPWHLVFSDDFRGGSLDTSRWTTCYDWNVGGCTNKGNRELEWYLPGQVSTGKNGLTLTARRSATQGTDGHTYPWTSGMISTGRDSWTAAPRKTFTYGYFEAQARLPGQLGFFPAFWMLPAQTRTTPPELDIFEQIASTRFVQMTVHWKAADGSDQHQDTHYGPVEFGSGYHDFAVDWEPDSLTWYIDGVQRYKVTDRTKIPTVPMELLLDLAVAYPFAPKPGIDSATMDVRHVRVWQH